jgi:nifR3 family TIM-barrel protein
MVGFTIGHLEVPTPVVLAPMAGVTNLPFRLLCRSFGPGLFVAEMVTSRALVERKEGALRMVRHDPSESPRSVQLYGVDPATVGAAARMVRDEDLADHIDLNFGCPVPKVTRKGGGAALPWKRDLFRRLVSAAVDAAGDIPVTVKMRLGIDDGHLTFMQAGLDAEQAGVAAITLHARTAAQHYSGHAHWDAIRELKREIRSIPVLGNGDVFSAEDALDMVAQTGCDGVVVGRGCQGRPWLFADLAAAFDGRDDRVRPALGQVCGIVHRHAELLVDYLGDEQRALRELRGHMSWYFKGYSVGGEARAAAHGLSSLGDLDALFARLDLSEPYPGAAAEGPRGRRGGV